MSLTNLIESVPDWQNKTPEQLHATLSDASILVEDHSLYTWAGVAVIAGDAGASALCSKLIEFGKLWAVHQLGGAGLDLANEEIQQQLYLLDSLGVPGMSALAQHVHKYISPLQQAGIEATVEQVAEALDDLLNPSVPDATSYEVLLSANRQANGDLNAVAVVTPVFLRDGRIVRRGEPVRQINGAIRDAVLPLIDGLIGGD